MKKGISLVISLVLILLCCSCSAQKTTTADNSYNDALNNENTLNIVSYNVAGPWGNLLKGTHYSTRIKLFAQQVKLHYPDVIGTQETNVYWVQNLEKLLPEYECYWCLRGNDGDGNNAEMNAIFYLKEKFERVNCGTFWLSKTPDEMSGYEGAGCYRICSWVLLRNRQTGYEFIQMNTHLDNKSEEAAQFGAGVILEKYKEITKRFPDIPVILSGDFNQTVGSATYNKINDSVFNDTRFETLATNNESTYNAWVKDATGTEPIDHIFTDGGFKVNSFSMLERTTDGKLVSDHFAIMAELGIQN